MRKILLTTTAMVALGSVSAIAADVSVSGNVRFRYNTWNDSIVDTVADGANNSTMTDVLQLWVKSSATTDNGLTLGTNTRILTGGTVDRNYISIKGDFGSMTMGKDWGVASSSSLGENWAATVAGGEITAPTGTSSDAYDSIMKTTASSTSGKVNKINYSTPSINGIQAKVSFADAGTAGGDSTGVVLQYKAAMADGNLTLGYIGESQTAADGASGTADQEVSEVGASFSNGMGRIWGLKMTDKTTENGGAVATDNNGTNFGVMYQMNDATKLIYYRIATEQDAGTNINDKYDSNTIGVRYDIAGGLRLGVLHTSFDFKDADLASANSTGSASRIEVRMDF